jgi:hypothetical protein
LSATKSTVRPVVSAPRHIAPLSKSAAVRGTLRRIDAPATRRIECSTVKRYKLISVLRMHKSISNAALTLPCCYAHSRNPALIHSGLCCPPGILPAQNGPRPSESFLGGSFRTGIFICNPVDYQAQDSRPTWTELISTAIGHLSRSRTPLPA